MLLASPPTAWPPAFPGPMMLSMPAEYKNGLKVALFPIDTLPADR